MLFRSDVTHTYTVIIRFDTTEHLKLWMGSHDRDRLIKKVEPFLVGADDFYISSGLDFWFTPAGAKARVPVRWKQFLITWSAIFPLAIVTPWFVAPPMGWLGIAAHSMLTTLAATSLQRASHWLVTSSTLPSARSRFSASMLLS